MPVTAAHQSHWPPLFRMSEFLERAEHPVIEVEGTVPAHDDLDEHRPGRGDEAPPRFAKEHASGGDSKATAAMNDVREVGLEPRRLVPGIWRREAAADVQNADWHPRPIKDAAHHRKCGGKGLRSEALGPDMEGDPRLQAAAMNEPQQARRLVGLRTKLGGKHVARLPCERRKADRDNYISPQTSSRTFLSSSSQSMV